MSNEDTEEQITLSSSAFDQFKDDDKPTTVTSQLSQEIRAKEQIRLFRIFDNKFLNVNQKTARGTISFFVKLSMLDPKPVRKRTVRFGILLVGFMLLGATWLTWQLMETGHPLFDSLYVYTVIVALAATGLIMVVFVIKEFRNSLVFYSQHGRVPIAELLYQIPEKNEFNKFVSDLTKGIEATKSSIHYSKSQLLAAELSEHRKLRDEGGISNQQYETAKKNIMALY